eukprot:4515823-Alexandrium_andersonii.AAC.1
MSEDAFSHSSSRVAQSEGSRPTVQRSPGRRPGQWPKGLCRGGCSLPQLTSRPVGGLSPIA